MKNIRFMILTILIQSLLHININAANVKSLFKKFFRVLRENSIDDKRLNKFYGNQMEVSLDYEKNNIKSELREEFLERHIGEYITHIRKIEGISWRKFFENTSLVEKILKEILKMFIVIWIFNLKIIIGISLKN